MVYGLVTVFLIFFRKLDGFFDVGVKDIIISVDFFLGSEFSGRFIVIVFSCSSYIFDVEVDILGDLG